MSTRTAPVRFGYADTSHGQLHYRRGRTPRIDVVLLHWAPASSRMFERVIPEFDALGIGAIAFDVPGFGASLKPPQAWGPVDMARNLLEGLDSLQATSAVVLGGHLSANVAVEAALLAPHRVPAVVLDGVYASTPEENAVLLAPYAKLSPRWSADGSHRSFPWAISEICLREWNPRFRPGPDTLAETYALLADYLQMGYAAISAWIEPQGPPPPPYDVLGRIARLEVPILVLGAQEEALRPCFDRALRAASQGRGHEFPGNHPLFAPGRAGEYAGVVSAFAQEKLR